MNRTAILLIIILTGSGWLSAQQADSIYLDAVKYRNIGPFRGGRSAAVTGVEGKRDLYYMGATGGGVWKTTDAGETWQNISDGYFGGSIGAIAVAPSDHNVIYVGGGEKTVRGNVSHGYGIFKSVDAGKTWKPSGLPDSRHISRIRVHPNNPDIAYAAVMGDLYQSTDLRGVYMTRDGGANWEQILFANEDAGAVDLCFDPTNPRILYASTWKIRRTPYSLSSGGEGSALWKSTDSGKTWSEISKNEGFPTDTLGIIGVTVSPQDPERVWAIVESKTGGVFRSDDGGDTWSKLNESRALRQRAWYYTRIYADSEDANIVYVLNVRYHKSTDGGKTFTAAAAPHGDHHDLWIDPVDNQRMIIGDDGGAQISENGGSTWSTYYNQPTAQFYRLATDNHFPFRIYAAQQDNSTVRISHRSSGGSIGEDDWESTAGCECGHIAVYPKDDDIVFGGCYDGLLERFNHRIDQGRAVNIWPDNPMGHGAEGMRYRFQWNFPLLFSPHDDEKLYAASNQLHVSTDQGQTWTTISPDLTRNDTSKMGPSGGPITKDNTSVEYYCTIFAVAESPRVKDLLWVGSDDGLVHISPDGGGSWQNVTPPDMPEWIMINSIEPDPHRDGGCYIAATMYKSGDFQPYLYHTTDFGSSWRKITTGIDSEHFTRVIRADAEQEGILYCGTESGMYISYDDGDSWHSFQLNLPIVPITDLHLKNGHLIVGTQGRGIWLIDDLNPIYTLESMKSNPVVLCPPKNVYRMSGSQRSPSLTAGTNHPGGVMTYFYLDSLIDTSRITLSYLDAEGDTIKTFSNKDEKSKLEVKQGANLFTWNMLYPDAEKFDGMILWWSSLTGPAALPGEYEVVLDVDGKTERQPFRILADPRSESSAQDLKEQFDFITDVNETVSAAHLTIKDIRTLRERLKEITPDLPDTDEGKELSSLIDTTLLQIQQVEEALYQTKNESAQDPLNFPIRLTNKLAHLNALTRTGDYAPTTQSIAVKNELTSAIEHELEKWKLIQDQDVPRINAQYRALQLDIIDLKSSTNGK